MRFFLGVAGLDVLACAANRSEDCGLPPFPFFKDFRRPREQQYRRRRLLRAVSQTTWCGPLPSFALLLSQPSFSRRYHGQKVIGRDPASA